MAITNYNELQSAVVDWAESNHASKAPTFISLAEARLNRELGAVETDATLTGVVGSRRIDISNLPIVKTIALFGTDPSNGDEWEVLQKPDGAFPYRNDTGAPTVWAKDGAAIDFDCLCDQAYSFRLRYRQKFALSDASPTNWLLTEHPDIYLAASMMWGAGYSEAWGNGQAWKSILDEGIPSIRRVLMQNNAATLSVDPALSGIGRAWRYGAVQ